MDITLLFQSNEKSYHQRLDKKFITTVLSAKKKQLKTDWSDSSWFKDTKPAQCRQFRRRVSALPYPGRGHSGKQFCQPRSFVLPQNKGREMLADDTTAWMQSWTTISTALSIASRPGRFSQSQSGKRNEAFCNREDALTGHSVDTRRRKLEKRKKIRGLSATNVFLNKLFFPFCWLLPPSRVHFTTFNRGSRKIVGRGVEKVIGGAVSKQVKNFNNR